MPHQVPVLIDPARFKVAVCGRRWGKSALGLYATVFGHGPLIDGKPARRGAARGGNVWWVAPTQKIAAAIWRDAERLCAPVLTRKNEVERRIELPGGGALTIKSAHEPGSLVGEGLDGLVVDEFADVHPDAWHESLRPTLSDRGGWAMFIGTPDGFNWAHTLFEHAGSEPGWARWQLPTSQNPLIPQSELDAAKRDSPAFFGQEYLAQFTSIEGAEWPSEWFDGIMFDEWPPDVMHMPRIMSLDPSKGKADKSGDYSAWISLAVDANMFPAVLWVDADMSQVRHTNPAVDGGPSIVEDGFRLMQKFQPHAVVIETNGFQSLVFEAFVAYCIQRQILNIPVYSRESTDNKESRIRTLGTYFSQRRVRVRNTPGGRILVQQLRDFRPKPQPTGYHDDGPDALKLAEVQADWLIHGEGNQLLGKG